MDVPCCEEKKARLRREGMVDALVDCLALIEQDNLHRTIQARVADTANSGDLAHGGAGREGGGAGREGGGAGREGAVAREGALVREGAHDGYLACRQWLAQGLDGEALAGRILQRIFTIWPREAADYQVRYDEFLEKELENPRATYYLSSREWMAAVEALRDDVMHARDLNLPPDPKLLRRCLKLLLTHTLQPGASAANLPPAQPAEPAPAHQPRLIT